jgi:hypothetical protein
MKINGLYVGQYVEVLSCPTIDETLEYMACSGSASHVPRPLPLGTNFCPVCGYPAVLVKETRKKLHTVFNFVYYGAPELADKFAVVEFPDTTSKYIIPNLKQCGYYDNQPDVIDLSKKKWQKALEPNNHPDFLLLVDKLKEAGFEIQVHCGVVLDAEE